MLTASAIGAGGRPGVFVRAGPPVNNSTAVRIYCSGISAPEGPQEAGWAEQAQHPLTAAPAHPPHLMAACVAAALQLELQSALENCVCSQIK